MINAPIKSIVFFLVFNLIIAASAQARLIVLPCVDVPNECTENYNSAYDSCLETCINHAVPGFPCADLCADTACAETQSSGVCEPCDIGTSLPPTYGETRCILVPGVYPQQRPGPWGTPPPIPENEIGIAGIVPF